MRKRTVFEPFQAHESCGEPRKVQEPYELEAPSIEKVVMRFSNLMEILYFNDVCITGYLSTQLEKPTCDVLCESCAKRSWTANVLIDPARW